MRRSRNSGVTAVVAILVAIGLLYGVAKGVMYLRMKNMMDQLIEEAADQAEITYQGISTDLGGSASVEGIRVTPLVMEDFTVTIERFRIASSDYKAMLLGYDWKSGKDTPPQQLGLDFLGVRMPLGGDAMPAGDGVTGCDGSGLNLEPQTLSELGFEEMVMDVQAGYRFDVPGQRLEAQVDTDVHQIQSFSMSVELDGVLPQDLQGGSVGTVGLASAELSVEVPRAFGDRYMQSCAQRDGISVDAFHTRLMQTLQQNLALSGMTIGPGLSQAMSEYYRDWGRIRIRMRPAKPLSMGDFLAVDQQQWGDMLGLQLTINDRPVTEVDLGFDLARMMNPQQGPAGQSADGVTGAKAPKTVLITRTYRTRPVAEIEQHIGRMVKIQPRNQPLREGVLSAIVSGEAVVEQRIHGGSVSVFVALGDIQTLQVQQAERVPTE